MAPVNLDTPLVMAPAQPVTFTVDGLAEFQRALFAAPFTLEDLTHLIKEWPKSVGALVRTMKKRDGR